MKKPVKKSAVAAGSLERESRGRRRQDASFPVPPGRGQLPSSYAVVLGEIKERIGSERLRVVMAANATMVILYWDIGRMILDRQKNEGWGAKVIDRLSFDLREAYPDMQGLSPRNLKYMRDIERRVLPSCASPVPGGRAAGIRSSTFRRKHRTAVDPVAGFTHGRDRDRAARRRIGLPGPVGVQLTPIRFAVRVIAHL